MKISGIIAEYNPFHNGHFHQITEVKKIFADAVVAVLSGNFTQRGESAIMSKFSRTEAALRCGADLVVELPIPWAAATAEKFAFGAVYILNSLGCVNYLSFGAESDLELLRRIANAVNSEQIKPVLKLKLSEGASLAAARERAINILLGDEAAAAIKKPNNILGIEYLKALHELSSPIIPIAVKRKGVNHDSAHSKDSYMSASEIRKKLLAKEYNLAKNYMPKEAYEILMRDMEAGKAPADFAKLSDPILAKMRLTGLEDLKTLPDLSEGLENRLYKAIQKSVSLQSVYELTKSKRYAMSRIRRLVLSSFLGISKAHSEFAPPYIRILGMNKTGEQILKIAKKTSAVDVSGKAKEIMSISENAKKIYQLECRSTDIFSLTYPVPDPCGGDMRQKIIKI